MGIIEVPCANIDCDSIDVSLVDTILLTCENQHKFQCNYCKTEFSIYTRLGKIKLKEDI